VLPRLDLASDPAPTQDGADPFAASLVSLSDAAAMALDAISERGVPPRATTAGTTVALAAARALRSATLDSVLAGLATPSSAFAASAPNGAGSAARIASALDAALAHRMEGPADADDAVASPDSLAVPAVAAGAPAPARADASSALAPPAVAGAAAGPDQGTAVAGLLAALAAETASASAGAGPDAVAKYMGAGFMGLGAAGVDAALEANPDVPAVNGVFQVLAQTPNTYSNPRERAYGQSAPPPSARSPATVAAAGTAMVDLLG
jgi:hypothetical protein